MSPDTHGTRLTIRQPHEPPRCISMTYGWQLLLPWRSLQYGMESSIHITVCAPMSARSCCCARSKFLRIIFSLSCFGNDANHASVVAVTSGVADSCVAVGAIGVSVCKIVAVASLEKESAPEGLSPGPMLSVVAQAESMNAESDAYINNGTLSRRSRNTVASLQQGCIGYLAGIPQPVSRREARMPIRDCSRIP